MSFWLKSDSIRKRFEEDSFDPAGDPPDVNAETSINLDELINRLVLFGEQLNENPNELSWSNNDKRSWKPLTEHEIKWLTFQAKKVFLAQPTLLELSAPVKICGMLLILSYPRNDSYLGDTHGQLSDLIRLFKLGGFPPLSNYLFLGKFLRIFIL